MKPLLTLALTLGVGSTLLAADPVKRPNILFAIADDMGYPYCSAYGTPEITTPAFDRVAKNGVLFTKAYSAAPGCSPSRAAILTGRPIWQLEHAAAHASTFPKHLVVFPDLLEKAGYEVALSGKGWGPGNFKLEGWEHNPAGPPAPSRKLDKAPPGVNKTDYAAEFAAFFEARDKSRPFCFWYGATEPHLSYDRGAGVRAGKDPSKVIVPPQLPDTPNVREDLLDMFVEIEHFDRHLGRMLKVLEEAGELENTLVVVTGDHGNPLPRAKANLFDAGTHVPLAIAWAKKVPGGRTVTDFVSLADVCPTFLDAAGVKHPDVVIAKSLMPVLLSDKSGQVDPSRDHVFTARERHSSSRPKNHGYPSRAVQTDGYLYVRNFAPDRWPAGDPKTADGKVAYTDIDASVSKSEILLPEQKRFLDLATAKRPAEELYRTDSDPGNLVNLADKPEYESERKMMAARLNDYLKKTGDPRVTGNGDIFETYKRYSPIRKFPGDE